MTIWRILRNTKRDFLINSNTYVQEYRYLGRVDEVTGDGLICFDQKNKFCVGDEIEFMRPDGINETAVVTEMYNEYGPVESCPHPGERIRMRTSAGAQVGMIMRMHGKGEDE